MQNRSCDDALDSIKNLAAQIKMPLTSAEKKRVIDEINDVVFQYQVSDKLISYAEEQQKFASWNIACGGRWVSPSTAPLANPTSHNKCEHDKCMQCCVAIIDVLKKQELLPSYCKKRPRTKTIIYISVK